MLMSGQAVSESLLLVMESKEATIESTAKPHTAYLVCLLESKSAPILKFF
jgi:hypothetical protein